MSSNSKPPFKDNQGRYRTKSLFHEFSSPDIRAKYPPVYTTHNEDRTVEGRKLKSAKKIFMKHSDPTNYQAVLALFGEWEAWLQIEKCPEIKSLFNSWLNELDIKMQSEALASLKDMAVDDKIAAKYIAEKGWEQKQTRKAGRPPGKSGESAYGRASLVAKSIIKDARKLKASK